MDDLTYIIEPLNSKNSITRNGIEKEKKEGNFIFRESEFSTRVLYQEDNKIIAGLHFVRFGDRKIISGIHTEEGYRKQGYMKKIISKARKKYGELEHSQYSSDLGKLFIENDKLNQKKSTNKLK
jgi:hypothetical protein